MEIFVDFGLFELLAALGIAALAKTVYRHKRIGVVFLLTSIAVPALLIFAVHGDVPRWLAACGLITACVNATIVLGAMQRGDIPTLDPSRWRRGYPSHKNLQDCDTGDPIASNKG